MIPEGWKQQELGGLLQDIKGGGTPSKKNPDFWHGQIPWASVKDITAPYRDKTADYITEAGLKDSASNLIPAGTVIIGTRMAVGKAVKFTCDVAINQDLKALFPKKELLNDFLFCWLNASESKLIVLASGSTVQGIRLESLKGLEVALPPLPEQKRIAEVLGGVDAAIEATKAVIEQTKKIKQGLLQTLLTRGIGHTKFKNSPLGKIPKGWEVRRLGDLCSRNGEYGANAAAIAYNPKLPRYVRITDIDDQGVLLKDTVRSITFEDAADYVLEPEDFLFARSGATVGKTYRHKATNGLCAYAGYLIRFRPKAEVLKPEFLEEITRSDNYAVWIKDTLRAGAQPNINAQEYGGMLIALPPVVEQVRIVKITESINEQLTTETAKLASLQQLKKGLMHDLLTGKVRVIEEHPIVKLAQNKKKPNKQTDDFRLVASAEPIYIHGLLRAEIVSQLGEAGAKKTEKVVSLAGRHCGLEEKIDRTEFRHAAGPYDGQSRHKIDDIFKQTKWFTVSSNGEKVTYKRATNHGGHKQDYQTYLGDYTTSIQAVIDLLKDETPEFCEKVATLYAAWNDLLIDGKRPTDAEIFAEFWAWHADKKQFTRTELEQAIAWMRRKNLVPTGKGRKTKALAA